MTAAGSLLFGPSKRAWYRMAKILKPRRRLWPGIWALQFLQFVLPLVFTWWMFVRLDVLFRNWLLWLAVLVAIPWACMLAGERARILGAGRFGEAVIARTLGRGLPAGWYVLHDVRVPASSGGCPRQIDHVIAGPSGIWAIETKCWRGEIACGPGGWYRWLSGSAIPMRDPVRQAVAAAAALGNELRRRRHFVWVQPAVAFVDSDPGPDMPAAFEGAAVVWDPADLVPTLLSSARPVADPRALGSVVLDIDRAARRRARAFTQRKCEAGV
ncbi:MAG TPA: hypothetical protein DEQ28_08825 [Clostridiales bacterium]|nr:hypothetical protein [Clostridiales bacterium]